MVLPYYERMSGRVTKRDAGAREWVGKRRGGHEEGWASGGGVGRGARV